MKILTVNEVNGIKNALQETKRLIAKELMYSKDLQKSDKIEYYYAHKAKLESMLNSYEV